MNLVLKHRKENSMTAEERAYKYASTQKASKFQVGDINVHKNNPTLLYCL